MVRQAERRHRQMRVVMVNGDGRVIGEDHHKAKLTDHDVWLITELSREGVSYRQIATKFEVSKSAIADICQGRRRQHIAMGQRLIPFGKKR